VKLVGELAQVPGLAVSTWPTVVVPLIVGGLVFVGAAVFRVGTAAAGAARVKTIAAASAAGVRRRLQAPPRLGLIGTRRKVSLRVDPGVRRGQESNHAGLWQGLSALS
jgi:hypothetical protein